MTAALLTLLVLVVLLAVPLSLEFRVSRRQRFRGDARLIWLFGLVRISMPFPGEPGASRKQRKPAPEKPRAKRAGSRRRSRPLAAIRQKAFRRRIIRFIGALWRAVRKEELALKMRIGLGDPAETGQLWALVGPVAGVLASVRMAAIDIQPEFMDACFEFDGSGRIRLIPLQITLLLSGLLLSVAFWQGIARMRAA